MIYRFGEVTFDSALYSVQRGGQNIRLRPKVFRACLYLLEHRDRVVSREELCTQVWGGRFVNQTTLEGVIRSVREVLGDSGRMQRIIQTSRGCGYQFVAGVNEHLPREVEKQVPQSDAPLRSPESALLLRTASVAAGVESAQRRGTVSAFGPPGEVKRGRPDVPGHASDRSATVARWEQCTAHQRTLVRWLLRGGGQRLAVVALVLVGTFGLWWAASHKAMGPVEKSRIAVLPFIDLSAKADQAYFADGMMQEVIAQLSQIPGLTVIARTSVLKYKGSLEDVATIGRELRVGTILEGSVRSLDKQVRVSVQLIDVASQGHLWSQEYLRELTGIFATQRDIASHLAQGLRVQLTAPPIYDGWEGERRSTANLA
jgi:TolB-like protein/DNA-binding winged helix-turn-helix (wHTH) protein